MNYKVEAWSWCADYCKKNQWNPHDSYFWNKANLEYRRQHNIFEVGDKVVYRNLPHERLFSVRYVGDDEIVVYELWDEMGAKTFTEKHPYSDIDHANDTEIEAGKRLEVESEN